MRIIAVVRLVPRSILGQPANHNEMIEDRASLEGEAMQPTKSQQLILMFLLF